MPEGYIEVQKSGNIAHSTGEVENEGEQDSTWDLLDYLEDQGKSPQDMTNMTRQEECDLAARVTALCLESENAQKIRYGDADDDSNGKVIPFPGPSQVGRNDPCPCGSGKKHKKCCMAKES